MKDLLKFDCRIIFAFIISVFCLIPQSINGAPAYPYPVEYELPDGSIITVLLKGDEFVNWRESADGYTMLFNPDGFLEYAEDDGEGGMRLSGIRASNDNRRTDSEKNFLKNQRKGLRFSISQIDAIGKIRGTREQFYRNLNPAPMIEGSEVSAAPIIGEIRIPIILVSFKDKDFKKTKADFEMLFDQENYTITGLPGSLRDYFYATSFGKLNLRLDVWGPYKMPKVIASYAANVNNNGATGNPGEMAAAAVDSIARNGANFADYADPNNPSNALAVHIIYAGYGEEAGAPTNQSIWAHASSFPRKILNGKIVSSYSCSAELRGNSGTQLSNIGVVAHELGHSVLKLPDYYDTDYASSGGQSVDMGSWELMASGNWNTSGSSGQGSTPALLSAYSRIACGWETENIINNPGSVTIPSPVYPDAIKTDIYRINTKTNNEYFLLENRQKTGWDAGIPGSGLLIYKVNKNANGGWGTGIGRNNLNSNPSDRGYFVMQANCTNINGCSQNRSTDPFPQMSRNSFTDETNPSAKSKAGANTGRPITNIMHNTAVRTISFDVGGTGTPKPKAPEVIFPTAEPVTYSSMQTLADVELTGGTTGRGTFEWKNPGIVPNVGNNGYEVVFTPSDNITYDYSDIQLTRTVALTVNKAILTNVKFPDFSEEFVYDPAFMLADISLDNLGEGDGIFVWKNPGVVPAVENNGYEIVFIPTDTEIYDQISQKVNLNIVKADYDMSGISFESEIFEFDGEEHSLSISGTLADGITVEYTGNGQAEIGVYDVEAVFSTTNSNYNIPEKMYAVLTIIDAVSIVDIPKSDGRFGIRFANSIVSDNAEIFVKSKSGITDAKFRIYDVTGNVIYSLTSSGDKVIWDLTNYAGRKVSNGTYLVVAEIKEQNGQVCRYSAKLGVKR